MREMPHADSYEIWQLKHTEENRYLMFMGTEYLAKHDLTVDLSKYQRVYAAPMEAGKTLDDLYTQFNLFHPQDFRGHSMSVSDLIILYDNGEPTPFYCDKIGFTDVSEFVTPEDIHRETEIADAVEGKHKPSIRLRLKEARQKSKEKSAEQQEQKKDKGQVEL